MNYDYIVVGAGSAGSIVAARLSENGRFSVLLLEAGGWDRNPWIHLPLGVAKTIMNPKVNWLYRTEPQPELLDRTIFYARGKVIGGSSAINGMVHVRGQRQDFDGWAAAGAEGWDWDKVLPYFKKSENHYLGDTALHASGGPVTVTKPGEPSELCQAFFDAAVNYGLPLNDDFNGPQQDGVGLYDLTVKRGLRSNSAKGALHPAKHRPNLKVEVHALAQRIQFDGRRAVGIEYIDESRQLRKARAAREVVLCSGAVNTPQLLMLSGIGPRQQLDRHGIRAVADRTEVGLHLQDHLAVRTICKTRRPITLNDQLRSVWGRMRMGMQFILHRRGPLTQATGQAGMFFRSSDDLPEVDAQAFLMPFSVPGIGQKPHEFSAFSVSVTQSWPVSRGHIALRDANPSSAPLIQPNFLSAAEDREFFLRAVPIVRRILSTTPLGELVSGEFQPGSEVKTPEDVLAFVRAKASTIYHPCGTCRMGSDSASVVDPTLRVRGVDGLRVADASVMPRITSGNINAACLMIGERAADLVLQA